jgi:hypothetical protein
VSADYDRVTGISATIRGPRRWSKRPCECLAGVSCVCRRLAGSQIVACASRACVRATQLLQNRVNDWDSGE